jgi:ketosteroid isomerase-like protein
MQIRGAEEYLALNERLLPAHLETRMLRQFAEGNQVCSIYELVMRTPAGGTLTIPMADWIQVLGGRVVEQRIYYDPRQFATAFGMQEGG